jgi:hypothetical protein
VIVTYLDLATGKTAIERDVSRFNLVDNNWSCDCNRQLAFGLKFDNDGLCLGCRRFIVIAVKKQDKDPDFDEADTIKDANSEYFARLQGSQTDQ